MIIEPKHPTEQYIERRIYFHESGAHFYAHHGQMDLAAWSKRMAAQWRAKLPNRVTVAPIAEKREAGDGE